MSGGSSYGSCCYADCTNSYSTNSNCTFYKFPNDEARRKKWILNCGNPEVAQLSDRHIRGKRICGIHFAESSFTDGSKRENLSDKAVPLKYTKSKPSEEEETETPAKRSRGGRQSGKIQEKAVTPSQVKARRISETTATEVSAKTEVKTKTVTAPETSVSDAKSKQSISEEEVPESPVTRTRGGRQSVKIVEKAAPSSPVKSRRVSESTSDVEKANKPKPAAEASPKSPKKQSTNAEEETVQTTQPRGRRQSKNQEPSNSALPAEIISSNNSKPSTEAIAQPNTERKRKLKEEVQNNLKMEKPQTTSAQIPPVRSKFGIALYSMLNDLLNESEPVEKKEKRMISGVTAKGRSSEPSFDSRNKNAMSMSNGRVIKQELRFGDRGRTQTQRPLAIKSEKQETMDQFMMRNDGGNNIIIQNGGEFTLAEGQEYEVIGESDGNEQIQVVQSDMNSETIEIIEVDDHTMAQLAAQNVFFPNSGMSGNIQVTELDSNMGQILKVINNSGEGYYHSSS